MAPAKHLGKRLQRFATLHIGGTIMLTIGVGITLVWAALTGYLLMDASGNEGLYIGALGVSVLFLPLAAIMTIRGYRGRHVRIDHHENGILLVDGFDRWKVTWADVQSVQPFPDRLVIHAAFTPPIVVDHRYPRHQELIALLQGALAGGGPAAPFRG